MLTIVGDSMGRPIVEAIEANPRTPWQDLRAHARLGGSILSSDVKARLFDGFPSAMMLTEAIGSSESPAQAISLTVRGQGVAPALEFTADDRTTVFDDDLRSVAPGSGAVGRLATRGRVPVGYFHDAEKSAHTFIDVDGSRWALPGDMATIEADGTIRLLGRGTMCINTGGEKVYPEEVEAILKTHPKIADAVVVGVPDSRFGEQVTAVFQPISGELAPSLAEVQAHCRPHLAGHKVPRQVFVVDFGTQVPVRQARLPMGEGRGLSGSVAGRTWRRVTLIRFARPLKTEVPLNGHTLWSVRRAENPPDSERSDGTGRRDYAGPGGQASLLLHGIGGSGKPRWP